jgi:acyl-CoA reductase-like NAD-dependent aldehyde dehydrogenase
MKEAASTIKNISLELGGKSPIVVFDVGNLLDAIVLMTI